MAFHVISQTYSLTSFFYGIILFVFLPLRWLTVSCHISQDQTRTSPGSPPPATPPFQSGAGCTLTYSLSSLKQTQTIAVVSGNSAKPDTAGLQLRVPQPSSSKTPLKAGFRLAASRTATYFVKFSVKKPISPALFTASRTARSFALRAAGNFALRTCCESLRIPNCPLSGFSSKSRFASEL